MTRSLLFVMLAVSTVATSAGAIVIRHDVDDAQYRVPASTLPALVDVPGEGHGVLIAPQWVVTAAHAVTWQREINDVMLNGTPRNVERLVLHPGYSRPTQATLDQALSTWDWTLFRSLLRQVPVRGARTTSDDVGAHERSAAVRACGTARVAERVRRRVAALSREAARRAVCDCAGARAGAGAVVGDVARPRL